MMKPDSLHCASSSSQDKMGIFGLNRLSDEETQPTVLTTPLVSNYNDRIRPLLDTIDNLRHLKVMQESIELPTIVVIGDQSSGKSSVLESLAGISLPRGQGICTRVPLIMRLQKHPTPKPELQLEFHDKVVPTDETHIVEAISTATDEIAGGGKCISHTPLTLIVKKNGVPDLTMVDLPGITRVPVHGQPDDICEQISSIIMEYISPQESIILNVLSATVDFPTCESIRMSQRVDKTGLRTLAVVTKSDKAPEGLQEKVTSDDVGIGLGYVCVRNRIGDETYEEARIEEAKLFESHPLLSKIDKSIVGIPVLAKKLVQIQARSIAKCLPDIVKKIKEKLNQNVSDLKRMPHNLSSVTDAMTAFMQILGSSKETLKKILIRGEFEEYPDEKEMHCTARMAEMLDKYSEELQLKSNKKLSMEKFLMEEIRILEETKGIGLPNFLPRTAFLTILQRKVEEVSDTPVEFVNKSWNYIEGIVVHVLKFHSESYPQLRSSTIRAAHNLITKMRDRSIDRVNEMVEMEKLADYTCNPEYMLTWNQLMAQQETLRKAINKINGRFGLDKLYGRFGLKMLKLEGLGEVEIGHLWEYCTVLDQAFDMKMRVTAYWKIVLRRLVDNLGLHLLFSIQNLVNKEMEKEIVKELMEPSNGGIERMLEESPSISAKRAELNQSIKKLQEFKEVVSKIVDRIAADGDCAF